MLRALELLLQPPIVAALPATVGTQLGPFFVDTSWPNNQRMVVIHAERLDVLEAAPSEDDDEPAFLLQSVTWATNGVTTNFVLPAAPVGTIHEVESPPGYAATRGDDYLVDGNTIRFYRAPATANPGVLARLRTQAAHGYYRRRRCAITLRLASYAASLLHTDDAFAIALQVALAQLTRAPRLLLTPTPAATVLVRVLEPRASIIDLERMLPINDLDPYCAHARLRIEGQLDLLVAQGSPAPTSVIESIEGEVLVDSSNGELPVADPTVFVPPEP